ncbi:hypothetical protein ABIC50_000985 [Burkholderia sp. 567]
MRGAGSPGGEVQQGMTDARDAHVTVWGRSRSGLDARTDAAAPVAIRMAIAPARRHPVD